MSIHIVENDSGTIKAYGCHDDLAYDEVMICAELTDDDCEVTSCYLKIRIDAAPVKIELFHFGENVLDDWENEIIKKLESDK